MFFPTPSFMPLHLQAVDQIPTRLSQEDKNTTKRSKVITSRIIKEYDITICELNNMKVCIRQLIWDYAIPPHGKNIIFSGIDNKTLLCVEQIFRDPIISLKIKRLDWFEVGLTVDDLLRLKPPISVLLVFNINMDTLLARQCYKTGFAWQDMFNWSYADWNKIGFNRTKYTEFLKTLNLSDTDYNKFSKWGPLGM